MGLHVFFVHAVMGLDIMIYYDMIMNRNVQPAEQPFRTYNYLSLFLDDLIFLFFWSCSVTRVCVCTIHTYVCYILLYYTMYMVNIHKDVANPRGFPFRK